MRYPPIAIVVSTFNGQKYIEEQISSLLQQDYPNISIIVRDDGSTDKTVDLLRDIQKSNPGISLIYGKNLGVAASFNELLAAASGHYDYIFLCDQDDFWHPEKVSISLSRMLETEKKYGKNTPILVHTDLQVVDEALQIIAPSFWKYQKLNGNNGACLNRLLLQNVVTGATVLINKALLEKSLPIQSAAVMHDWWLALNACVFGKVVAIDRPLISYRQHSANAVGAHGTSTAAALMKLTELDSARSRFVATIFQAEALQGMHAAEMSSRQLKIIDSYTSLLRVNHLKRLAICWRNRFFKTGLIRNCGLLLILLMRRDVGRASENYRW